MLSSSLFLACFAYCLALTCASALPAAEAEGEGNKYAVQSAAERAEVVTIIRKRDSYANSYQIVINEYVGMQVVRQNLCSNFDSVSIPSPSYSRGMNIPYHVI